MENHVDAGIEFLDKYKVKLGDLEYADQGGTNKASGKQRGYIKGLCKKLEIDPHTDLNIDVDDMTISEASETIESLKDMTEFSPDVRGAERCEIPGWDSVDSLF